MNTVIKRAWNKNKLVNVEDLTGMTFQAESGGHTFEISGVDDTGAAVSLSGTVEGRFLRADNAEIIISGTASGGKASVTLTAACYAIQGRFLLTIYVTSGGQKVAVYAATGSVVATSGTASGSIPPLVTDSVQANTGTFGSISAGDTTVDGVLDVTQRRCEAAVSEAGWYRVFVYNALNEERVSGDVAFLIDVTVLEWARQSHKITLYGLFGALKFWDEVSVTNTSYVDKIRYVKNGTHGYIDIHYDSSSFRHVACYFDVKCTYPSVLTSFASVTPTKVDDSPSGETELALYMFVANTGTPVSFSPTSGSAYRGCWYARIGNVCYLHVDMQGLTPSTNTKIFTLPVGYRPLYSTTIPGGGQESHGALASCSIQTDGSVYIYSQDHYAIIDGNFICKV